MTFDFRNPDYDAVFRERAERLKRLRAEPGLLPGVLEYYKSNPVAFINDWFMTFDPRNAEVGIPTVVPFVLFPKQAEFVDWVVSRWKGREDGLVEKSRDMGASWLCVAIAVWMWRFHNQVVIGFGSRKEAYVDSIGDPKTLFWKAREAIRLLPIEFRPKGFDPKSDAPYMRILNPENGSSIIGEAGDNIGRGARTSVYFVDEAAYLERPDVTEAALSQTSNCRIWVSTPNGSANPFYRKRHSGKVPVFTFHWAQDPRKDEAWYKAQCEKLDPIIVAQEIDISYDASVADSWIDGEKVTLAQRTGPADVVAIGPWFIGVDAAHMGDDESIIHKRKGRLNLPQVSRRGIDGVTLAGMVAEECRVLTDAGDKIGGIIIELDGPGVSCFDQLQLTRWKPYVVGVHTGARQSDDRNYNLRAKLWRSAAEYLADSPVSLPNCAELKAQLASMRYSYRDGLLLMQSKKDYKKAFGRSPDKADAFILTFGAPEGSVIAEKPLRSGQSAFNYMRI